MVGQQQAQHDWILKHGWAKERQLASRDGQGPRESGPLPFFTAMIDAAAAKFRSRHCRSNPSAWRSAAHHSSGANHQGLDAKALAQENASDFSTQCPAGGIRSSGDAAPYSRPVRKNSGPPPQPFLTAPKITSHPSIGIRRGPFALPHTPSLVSMSVPIASVDSRLVKKLPSELAYKRWKVRCWWLTQCESRWHRPTRCGRVMRRNNND